MTNCRDGDAENARKENAGLEMRHQNAGVEYAGLENAVSKYGGGKCMDRKLRDRNAGVHGICRTGKCEKIKSMENCKFHKISHAYISQFTRSTNGAYNN